MTIAAEPSIRRRRQDKLRQSLSDVSKLFSWKRKRIPDPSPSPTPNLSYSPRPSLISIIPALPSDSSNVARDDLFIDDFIPSTDMFLRPSRDRATVPGRRYDDGSSSEDEIEGVPGITDRRSQYGHARLSYRPRSNSKLLPPLPRSSSPSIENTRESLYDQEFGSYDPALLSAKGRLVVSPIGTQPATLVAHLPNGKSPVVGKSELAKDVIRGIGDSARVAFEGFTWLAKAAEPFVSGTPFETPLAVVNFLIDSFKAIHDNREDLRKEIQHARKELAQVNEALIEGMSPRADLAAQQYAKVLVTTAVKLKVMLEKAAWTKIVSNESDREELETMLNDIHRASVTFHGELLISIDSSIQNIKEILMREGWPVADEARFDNSIHNGCAPQTRLSTLKLIWNWASDRSQDSAPIFWLSGPAGSGKSTIAYSVANRLADLELLGASFFCARQFPARRDPLRIIPTVVKAMTFSSRAFASALVAHGRTDRVFSRSSQAQDLLVAPLTALASFNSSLLHMYARIIVIDALDELEGTAGSEFLDFFFRAMAPLKVHGFKFLITSREVPEIVELCQTNIRPGAIFHLQSIAEGEVTKDIHRYLRGTFPKLHQTQPDQLWAVAERSRGLFVFAATAVRYAMPPGQRFSATQQGRQLQNFLSHWPSDTRGALPLDVLYTTILELAFSEVYGDVCEERLRILLNILCVLQPPSLEVIAWLSVSDLVAVSEFVQSLHAVMYVDKDTQHVTLYHKSFADFLFDPSRSGGGITASLRQVIQTRSLIASKGIELLCSVLHFNMTVPSLQASLKTAALPYDFQIDLRPAFRFASSSVLPHLESAFVSLSSSIGTLGHADQEDISWHLEQISFLLEDLEPFLGENVLYLFELGVEFPFKQSRRDWRVDSERLNLESRQLSFAVTTLEQSLKPICLAHETEQVFYSLIQTLIARTIEVNHDLLDLASFGDLVVGPSNADRRSSALYSARTLYMKGLTLQPSSESRVYRSWKALFRGLPEFTEPVKNDRSSLPPPCLHQYDQFHELWISDADGDLRVDCDNLSKIVTVVPELFEDGAWVHIHKTSWNLPQATDGNVIETDISKKYRRIYLTDIGAVFNSSNSGILHCSFDPSDFGRNTDLKKFAKDYKAALSTKVDMSDSDRSEHLAWMMQAIAGARANQERFGRLKKR